MRTPNRELCGALLDRSDAAFDRVRKRAIARGQDPEAAVRAYLRHRGLCTRPALANGRCRWHGGLSVGGTSDAGKARTVKARRDMVAEVHDAIARGELERVPWGRKAGGRNRPKEVIAQERFEKRIRQEERRITGRANADRRARKQVRRQQREEAAEIKRRHECFQRGQPFWSDLAGGERAKDAPAPSSPPERLSKDDDVLQFSDWGSALDHVERVMTIDRARRGVRNLEKQFVDHLARGWLDQAEAEQGYRLFMRFEELIDRGELADRQRRGKLEKAFDEWCAVLRTHQLISHRALAAEARAASPPPQSGPHSIAPWLRRL